MKIRRPFTTYVIDARKTAGLTQEQAAELIGVSVNTLQKYEAEDIRIHDDIACRMALTYRDPRIRKLYCEYECVIGGQEKPCECGKSMDALMLDLLLEDKDLLPDTVRTLHRILSDGVVDDTETEDCNKCLEIIDTMEKRLAAIRIQTERVCGKNKSRSSSRLKNAEHGLKRP